MTLGKSLPTLGLRDSSLLFILLEPMQDRKDWRGQGKVGDVYHLFPYKERFQEGKTCQENGVHLDSTFRLVQGMGWPVGG